jgi:ubiquitin C-terminal hydrolase
MKLVKSVKEILKSGGKNKIINRGNQCYINSILQCLFNCVDLTSFFLSNQFEKDLHEYNRTKNIQALQYADILRKYWENPHVLDVKKFIKYISSENYPYHKNNQEDSHEALMYILDKLHESLKYQISISITGTAVSDTDLLYKQYLDNIEILYGDNYSKIIELFYGMYYNIYKCIDCNHTVKKFEPYNTIYLSAPTDTCNIHDLLKDMCKKEIVSCSKCSKTNCTKKVSLWTIPDNLIINLQRTDNTNTDTKTLVNYPLNNLNLTPYISDKNGDFNNYIYDLYAINFYQLLEIDSGHYHSCCKTITGEWIYFNDNHVIKINDETLLNRIINKNACILMYKRKTQNNM